MENEGELNTKYKFLEFNLYKNLVYDSPKGLCIFKSIDNLLILLYSDRYNFMKSYNLSTFQMINENRKANKTIYIIKHCFDKNEKRDLIMTAHSDASSKSNSVIVWDFKTWEFIHIFQRECYDLESRLICFINNQSQILIFIFQSKDIHPNIKNCKEIYDLDGKKIKEININDNGYLCFIDSFYDEKLSKNFILLGFDNYALSYDYKENTIFKKYETNSKSSFYKIFINKKKEVYELITLEEHNIRIWDFHSGVFVKDINLKFKEEILDLHSMYFLNNRYILLGSYENIILFDLEEGNIIKSILAHGHTDVINISKFKHPKYGECLITRSSSEIIKCWIIKNP